ncbi:ankyrin repeat domain-containing protein [Roseovarius sp. EL26]|uniref:ankyrin repeat domain-containing protein n=1 Tax=Roseovarius sp. EL26 TaxID=2126672 RepID=UPI000EA36CC8|nr:ankyrin repeat domain-containing protein [Roseovarius sp. EL26]
MPKRAKERETLEEILISCSDTIFPEELGAAPVTLNSRDVDGDTPLHVLLWRKNTYGALLLIEAGADVNAVGDMSETPLHIAVKAQDVTVIGALLKAGANVSFVSEFGQSPLDLAKDAGGDIKRVFLQSRP